MINESYNLIPNYMPEPHGKPQLNHCANIYHRCSKKRCEAQAQKRPKKWQC